MMQSCNLKYRGYKCSHEDPRKVVELLTAIQVSLTKLGAAFNQLKPRPCLVCDQNIKIISRLSTLINEQAGCLQIQVDGCDISQYT